MSIDLNNKVVIVTGAGRGIGRAIARTFAREHTSIVLASRTESELQRVAEEVRANGGTALVLPTDVTREEDARRMVDSALRSFGRVDILINNAGIGLSSKVVDMRAEDLRSVFEVNLFGVFYATKAVLPHMMKQNDGVIVNISSLAGRNAFVGGAGYCASKWALIGFSRCLMLEVREHNIRVITICPGSVDTSFSHSVPGKTNILHAEDVAETILAAVKMPQRAMVSEIDIRPTNPR